MISKKNNHPVLFINPSLGTKKYEEEDSLRGYLSLGTLASAIKNQGFLRRFAERSGKEEIVSYPETCFPVFDIDVLNLSLKPARQSIYDYFSEYLNRCHRPPFIVCMTATSAHLDEAGEVARAAKQMVPAALRIIGGPHVSVAARDYLNHSAFQVACIGEGVETLSEIVLLAATGGIVDFSVIEGIAYKNKNGGVISNPARVPLFELDEYPFPSDSLASFRKAVARRENNKSQLIYILSGYGCPHSCIFCAQRAIHDQKVRERSAGNIIEEIRCLYARGFRKFAFVQETFLNRKNRIHDFCRLVEESKMQIEWTAEARADQLDYEQLKRMHSAGLRFIQIGVESGDPVVLNKIGKGIDLNQIIQLRQWCNRLNINTAFYLLVGLPGQDWQSILRTALFVKDHPPYNRITKHASVSIAVPYPGTQMWQEQSVRLVNADKGRRSWPWRNPDVTANDDGEFVGRNFTETDDLTPNEILEAWLYLDDYCHFLLHALVPDPNHPGGNAKLLEYADRMLYMIERRTIRDLIVRAQTTLSAEKRRKAYNEIANSDQDIEKHFKDVTTATENFYDVFARFLAAVNYTNGFDTMKFLSIANRIKWMKLCAIVWHLKKRKINEFKFDKDDTESGAILDGRLQELNETKLNQYLVQFDVGVSPDFFPEINQENQQIFAFGFSFSDLKNNTIEINLQ